MENFFLLNRMNLKAFKKPTFFLFALLLLHFSPFAQKNEQKTIDSLTYLIKDRSVGLEKAKALVALSEIIHVTDKDSSFRLCQQALSVLSGVKLSNLVLKEQEEFKQTKAHAYNNIGAFYYDNGSYSKAIHFLLLGTKIREQLKDARGLTESYNNIAYIYKQQADTLNANIYYKKSLFFAEKTKSLRDISVAYYGLASVCDVKSAEKALSYYFKSLDIEKKLDNQVQIAKREHNIGTVYQNINNYKLASEWYLKSIQTKTEIEDNKGISTTLISLANLKLKTNAYREAELFAKKAYLISKEEDILDNLILSSELLYKIYFKEKKYKEALDMFVEATEGKERALIEANETETVKLQLNYDFEKKTTADSIKTALEKENLNVKLQDEKEKQIGLYLFLGITLAFSILIFNRFRKTKKQKTIIEDQKSVVELKNKEITDSINYAQRIQQTLLANEELLNKKVRDHFIIYRPKDIVSGDFYWASQKEHLFYLAVCDSTGHGVPGAFMSLLNISFLNEAVNEKNILEPNEIFNYVRQRLINNLGQDGAQDGMDGVLLCINSLTKTITYSAAYNAPIVISNNEILNQKANRMPIGKSPKENDSFTNFEIPYQENSLIYLYTDGYTDQFGGPKGKKFKLNQLQNKLQSLTETPFKEQEKELVNTFDNWKKGYDQIDDMLLIGIKI